MQYSKGAKGARMKLSFALFGYRLHSLSIACAISASFAPFVYLLADFHTIYKYL